MSGIVAVAAADVTEVHFKCPQCGGKSEVEGAAGVGGCRGGDVGQALLCRRADPSLACTREKNWP